MAGRKALQLGAVIGCAALACALAACGGSSSSSQQASGGFLSTYARSDGQVVRTDQGGDTVSEGQAYGMLVAEATGNDGEFQTVWNWTRGHLQLGDGLFAWHANAAGQVIGQQPASDADLLIAWALLRYSGSGATAMHSAGRKVAAAILAHEVTTGPGGMPLLTAGPWATGRPATLDPSYWSLPAMQGIATLTGDSEWQRLATGSVSATKALTDDGRMLPPDWAELTASGALQPEPAPSGNEPQTQYGPDAQRTVAWFAASCDPAARTLAAQWWPLLRPASHADALALSPNGTVLSPDKAVLPLVASASAAKAANDNSATSQLLNQAAAQQRNTPTYYGGAWEALGQDLLTTTTLSTC
jgi:endoglucanase